MKPDWVGKPMALWPLRKLIREHKFARIDLGWRHPWTRLLRLELMRRRPAKK